MACEDAGLFAMADMLDWTEAQLTWTNLKPRFQKQFATQTDEKQFIDGLSNLAMGPNKTTGEDHQHNGDHQGELRGVRKQSSGTSYRRSWAWTSRTSGEHGNPMEKRHGQQHVAVHQDATFQGFSTRRFEKGHGTT
jgi:hypothetical protein